MVSLNEHPTWVRRPRGHGPLVTLLHGGMSDSSSMLRRFEKRMSKDFTLAAFDRRGHGRTPDRPGGFHYDEMAEETIAFLEYVAEPSHLIGHSDGGVVALLTAMRRPDLVKRAVLVGANFHYDGLVAASDFALEGPEFDAWARDYAEISPDGIDHARDVVQKALTLFASEPTLDVSDLASISVPILVMAGDDDVVSLAHTCAMYGAIPDAQLAVLPASSHALLKEHPGLANRIISHFLRADLPVKTLNPIRRATRSKEGSVNPDL
jgi:pimeloyl-ACP methyl ester carboxylesterase